MDWKKSLAKRLTPKNTEEIKPRLFIQETRHGTDLISRMELMSKGLKDNIDYPKYRHITPASWNEKVNWPIVIFGVKPIKSFIFFLMIIFLAFAYQHDIQLIQDTAIQLTTNVTFHAEFCNALETSNKTDVWMYQICNNTIEGLLYNQANISGILNDSLQKNSLKVNFTWKE